MEKRERRDRHQRRQASNQRYGGGPRQGNCDVTRDNKRTEAPPAKPVLEEKKTIDHTAIPDPHMFDNLKRETEDIAALTVKAHSGKRQIFSNWAKYEMPSDEEDDQQAIGADFESLLQSAQMGAQYQLRSERSWDPKSLPTQNAAFTIDLGVLAASLACLPLYEKLDLPLDVFTTEELEHMERCARCGRETRQEKAARGAKKEGLTIYGSLLEKLRDIPSENIASELSSFAAADTVVSSDARKSVERTPEREQALDHGGNGSFDFGAIPMRSSSERSSAPCRKERSVEPPTTMPLREPSPNSKESLPKQHNVASAEVQQGPSPEQESVAADESGIDLPQLSSAEDQPSPVEPDAERKAPVSEGPTEVQGRKKSRSGRNKGNKRHSWGQEAEEIGFADPSAAAQPEPPAYVQQVEVEKCPSPDHHAHLVQSTAPTVSHEITQDCQSSSVHTEQHEEPPVHVSEVVQLQQGPSKPSVVEYVNKEKPRRGDRQREAQCLEPVSPITRSTPPLDSKVKEVAEPLAVPKVKPQRSEVKRGPPQQVVEMPMDRNVQPSEEPKKSLPMSQSNTCPVDKPKYVPQPNVESPPKKEEDQLDFLLSLRKPIVAQQVLNFTAPTTAVRAAIDEDEPVVHPPSAVPEKKDDNLEDWLDSMLDD